MNELTSGEMKSLFPNGTLISITPIGRELVATRIDTGEDVTNYIRRNQRLTAHKKNCGLRAHYTKTNGVQFRKHPAELIEKEARLFGNAVGGTATIAAAVTAPTVSPNTLTSDWTPMTNEEIREFVGRAVEFKPEDLIISEINWKYLCRSSLRAENILMVGPSGCGKTMACQAINKTFKNRPYFYFNLGASQDPRGMLIGNTHYDSSQGTFFSEAYFVNAIQTPGAIILLDELSRAHDDAANILMTVLDKNQRYLRIDEMPGTRTIPVADGVVFLATANVGNEYTGARVMDRALLDRFVIVEMDAMDVENEMKVLKYNHPDLDERTVKAIAEIACHTRTEVKSDDPKVNAIISTRMTVEMGGLIVDGFSLADTAEVCVYPFYSAAGGTDSERTYMQQLVQKWLPTDEDGKERPWDSEEEVNSDDDVKVPWS